MKRERRTRRKRERGEGRRSRGGRVGWRLLLLLRASKRRDWGSIVFTRVSRRRVRGRERGGEE
jgi:hypothetical protein